MEEQLFANCVSSMNVIVLPVYFNIFGTEILIQLGIKKPQWATLHSPDRTLELDSFCVGLRTHQAHVRNTIFKARTQNDFIYFTFERYID